MDYDVSVEWKMYVCMTYISRCGAIKYKFSNTKPIMWGLQLSLVSEWRWLYNNQGPTGASAEWVWHGSGVHIYPWGGHWLDMTPSHLTHEHHTSIKGGGEQAIDILTAYEQSFGLLIAVESTYKVHCSRAVVWFVD